ncbi:hypothetical protein NI17_022645 [Thermobifida halotolerans]|uniref:Uncharacterized protein n=1 Tax=Thermobifida halotolerans TaxID=483545 RepID=A0AA97M3Y6_9ACTN|nr:hypothetical protein [Thermobifida halotolerans]UOE19481.1 hypothetical protein NI17_022645 [Thermobifida halotolerans]
MLGEREQREPADGPATTDHIAHLRALACGTHRTGRHWPAHATEDYYARRLRTPLRRRIADALCAAAPALAFAAGSLLTLLAAGLLP